MKDKKKFSEMDTPQKRNFIIKWSVLGLLVVGIILTFVFYGQVYGADSVFQGSPSGSELIDACYQKIPMVLKSISIIVIAVLLQTLIRTVLNKMFMKSNRGITIVKLVESFVKWIIAIVALILVLAAFGVDTATLLASAGILTLVIGLGAQSLVADIVAGMFIVFEGEYIVGDIVVIDGWRGTVKEIGIRTTKVEDAGGNIMIINNSEIKTIVNQTVELSLAKCTVGVEYGESLERVEAVIGANMENLKKNIPAIVEGPYYKGVTALNTSSVDLLFLAKCHEEDFFQVQRDLNREIKLMFDRNNINIPFPQVVVNAPTDYKNQSIDKKTKKDAKDFIDEQKVLSKKLEEKD